MNDGLHLLFISENMTNILQPTNHVRHFTYMFSYRHICTFLISVKVDDKLPKLGSQSASKFLSVQSALYELFSNAQIDTCCHFLLN